MTRTIISVIGLAIVFCAVGLAVTIAPSDAYAESEQELLDRKTAWQDKYRTMLRDAATLEQDAKISRKNSASANRRNYPRGAARQQFITDAETAERELIQLKQEIEQFTRKARLQAIPRHWIYEVDDETVIPASPASVSGVTDDPDGNDNNDWDEDQELDDDREARNPLYYRE